MNMLYYIWEYMNNQPLTSLLAQVTTLNNHYKKINDLTGENFNIFRILKLESSEVRLHSAFLASLLNPKGDHGLKDSFLKLFVKDFCFKQNVIDTKSCLVEIEKHTGFISEDRTEGGRIDILITDKFGVQIVVENKIYAGDQDNQLVRYHKKSPDADLIYLTLLGKEPSASSCGELILNEHFKCSSYKTDVINWLEGCRKEAAMYPIVRESITQYINLVKHLTNQTLNQSMEKELHQLLAVNLESAFTISNNLDSALGEIMKEYISDLQVACSALGLTCHHNIDFDKNYTGIWINKEGWKHVTIGFQFQRYDKQMVFGIVRKQIKTALPAELSVQFASISDNAAKTDKWWVSYKKLDEQYGDWSKFEAWKAIIDGSMKAAMLEKIVYLLGVTEGMGL